MGSLVEFIKDFTSDPIFFGGGLMGITGRVKYASFGGLDCWVRVNLGIDSHEIIPV